MSARVAVRWFICAMYALALAFASLAPVPPDLPMPAFPGADKLAHAAAYAVLALLLAWAWGPGRPGGLARRAVLALACGLYGGVLELGQSLLTRGAREPSGWDMLANLVGAAAAALMVGQRKKEFIQNHEDTEK